jgi:outer membrane protein insertion porin family
MAFAIASRVLAQTPPSTSQNSEATAPSEQILTSYEGQNVSSIEIAGRPDITTSQFNAAFVQKVGQPFHKDDVDRTAVALQTKGRFQGVHTQIEPESKGLRILFVVEPAVYFGIFLFPGAERFPYSQLVQTANYPIQTPFNAADLEQDRQSLKTFFEQEGYFQATVDSEVEVDREHGVANIVFRTDLGRRARFGIVKLDGAAADDEELLGHKITTTLARIRGAAIRPGKVYHHSTITKAAHYLRTVLEKRGLLGAEVKAAGAEYHADTNRADIHFSITPGVVTHVQITGAHLWSWTQKSVLPVYQGVVVDDEIVEEGRQALASYFQRKGYFDVTVQSELKKETRGDTIVYRITKEKKHKVTAVRLSGNTQLPSSQLTPSITVTTKHLFSSGKFSDQLLRASVKNLTDIYHSEGFSSVAISSAVSRQNGDVHVAFRVVEGPRDIVHSVKIEGDDTFPESQFAPGGLKVSAGQPYSQAHVAADRANIVSHYLKAGYLASSFRETATAVSKSEPHSIDVVYHIYEGPRVVAGNVLTLGRVDTRQRLVNGDMAGIQTGKPLTELELLRAGTKLYDHTGVFDWAEVDPKQEVTTQTQEDVLVKVHEAKKNEFTYSLGFEVIERGGSIPSGTVTLPNLPPIGLPSNFTASETTFYGPRGSVEYTRNNLFGKGESVSFTAFAGRLDQRGAIYYVDPNFRWSPWKATTSFSIEQDEENPIFSSEERQGSFQIQRPLDQTQKNTLFLRYSFSQTDLTRVLIPDLVPAQDQHVRLSTLAANLTHDTRDNALDEHKGMLDTIELDFNTSKLGSSVDFVKLTGQAAFYKEKFHHIVWADSLRIGLAEPFNNSFVPLSEAFFSGGGNSLRGFPLDGAGPQREVQVCPNGLSNCGVFIPVPTGGNELLIFNSEARIPIPLKKGLSIVPFYDGGNVFPDVGFHRFTSLYANNVGIGLRYITPVGPIRVDIGRNLNPIPGINATQYFISIGQAF